MPEPSDAIVGWSNVWVGNGGDVKIGPEWDDVRIRRDGWPDQRYRRGREMVEHFKDA